MGIAWIVDLTKALDRADREAHGEMDVELRWLAIKAAEFRTLIERVQETLSHGGGGLTEEETEAIATYRLREIAGAIIGLDEQKRVLEGEAESIRRLQQGGA